ncbi:MAG TPA: glycosyltransferase family 9 protein [Acidobacteriaceae bacterium]|nr:glycosyltransferase family 9 protein [Acidobacteriaceae bacterium]
MPQRRKDGVVDENSFVQRVLIYRLGSLGDTIVALPSLHLVARAFPRAERRLLTNFPVQSKAAAAETILDGSGLVDGYFSYAVGLRHLNKLLKLRNEIRAWQPDVLIYLMGARGTRIAKRDAMFFRSCRISRQIGVPFTEDMQENRWRAATGLFESEAARLARCVAELGDARLDDPASWDLRLTEAEYGTARLVLEPAGKRPIIAFSIGTKVQANDWGDENWSELLVRMAQLYPDHALLITGAAAEYERSNGIANGWKSVPGSGPVLNLCGQLQPRESAATVSHAKIFLGHDSGPMHMAAIVQTPLVAIFSARNMPGIWYPQGPRHAVIYHDVECAGCGLETCTIKKKKCITSITIEEVLARVKEIAPPLVSLTLASSP